MGQNKVFIAWEMRFDDIRVSLYLNHDNMDISEYQSIGEIAERGLIQESKKRKKCTLYNSLYIILLIRQINI